MRILVVEDEKKIATFVQRGLKEFGFVVDVVHRGDEALAIILDQHFDAVVLDIMLPGRDGLSILRALRERANCVPVLILTARGEISEKVEGLNLGADDYLAKPFSIDELAARVRALIRRNSGETLIRYRVDDLALDLATRAVRRGESPHRAYYQRIFRTRMLNAKSGPRFYPDPTLPTRLGISFRSGNQFGRRLYSAASTQSGRWRGDEAHSNRSRRRLSNWRCVVKRWPIRSRLAVWTAFFLTVELIVFGIGSGWVIYNEQLEAFREIRGQPGSPIVIRKETAELIFDLTSAYLTALPRQPCLRLSASGGSPASR